MKRSSITSQKNENENYSGLHPPVTPRVLGGLCPPHQIDSPLKCDNTNYWWYLLMWHNTAGENNYLVKLKTDI